MTLFAYGEGALKGPVGDGLLHGLKLVAVAIVAQAVLGMAQSPLPGPAARDDRRPVADPDGARAGGVDPDRCHPSGRHRRSLSLPARRGMLASRRRSRRGSAGAWGSRSPALYVVLLALSFAPLRRGRRGPRRCFLPLGGAGVRRRPRRPASAPRRQWSIRAGSPRAPFSLATAPRRPFPARCSPSPPISARSPAFRRAGSAGAAVGLVAIFAPGLLLLMAALVFWQELAGAQRRARRDGWRQRRRRRSARFGAL